MTDPIERALAGLDAPRVMPPGLADRIARALGEAALGEARPLSEARPLGEARALPDLPGRARKRIEGVLARDPGTLLHGTDGPREMPPELEATIARSLASSAETAPVEATARSRAHRLLGWGLRQPLTVRALAVAASLVLIVASVVALRSETRPPTHGSLAADAPAKSPMSHGTSGSAYAPAPVPAAPSSGGLARSMPGSYFAIADRARGNPPPFTFAWASAVSPAALSGPTAPENSARVPTAQGSPISIGVAGSGVARAAFDAYLDLANEEGGAGGHELRGFTAGPSAPTAGAIATVNLGTTPVATSDGAPPWVRGVLFEAINAPERVLHGNVFGASSPPERQAHLAADAVFPSATSGKVAVVYHTSTGEFADEIPAAFETALRARGVAVARVTFDPSTPVFVPGDAAFLAMSGPDAATWFDSARASSYSPALGVAGIWTLMDASVAKHAATGTRILSPYGLPTGDEAAVIARETGKPMSAELIHGWITAKMIAAAIWQTGADTPTELRDAIRGLGDYSPDVVPEYRVRSGTNARAPEAVLYRVRDGALARSESAFRRDPF